MEQRQSAREVRVEHRADDKGAGTLIGYGAVFFNSNDEGTQFTLWPGVVERVAPDAFKRAISKSEGDDVRGLFNHDSSQVLGRTAAGTMKLSTDTIGLLYEIELADTQADKDLAARIERGDISGSSFSFDVRGESWETTDDGVEIRTLEDVRLFDVGPVTYPAYLSTTAGTRADTGLDDAKASHESWKNENARSVSERAVEVRARAVEVEGHGHGG